LGAFKQVVPRWSGFSFLRRCCRHGLFLHVFQPYSTAGFYFVNRKFLRSLM
jgi:hypothetical protein